jgi:hypothetical protein
VRLSRPPILLFGCFVAIVPPFFLDGVGQPPTAREGDREGLTFSGAYFGFGLSS